MTINSINRLLKVANRLVKIDQQLFNIPAPDVKLDVLEKLFTDPTTHFSKLLESIPGNSLGDEIIEGQLSVPEPTSQFFPSIVHKTSDSESSSLGLKTSDPPIQYNNLLKPVVPDPQFSSLIVTSMLPSVSTVFETMTALYIQPLNSKTRIDEFGIKQRAILNNKPSPFIIKEKKLQDENKPAGEKNGDINKVINEQNSTESYQIKPYESEASEATNRKTIIPMKSDTDAEISKVLARPGPGMTQGSSQIADVHQANVSLKGTTEFHSYNHEENQVVSKSSLENDANTTDIPDKKHQQLSKSQFDINYLMEKLAEEKEVVFPAFKMVHDPTQIAHVLQANVPLKGTTEFHSYNHGENQVASKSSIENDENTTDIPDKEDQLPSKSQFDINYLMEKLADQLEFELLRTYGTSGR